VLEEDNFKLLAPRLWGKATGKATGRRVSGNGRAKLGKQRSAPTGNQRSLIAKRREKANEVGRGELIEDCPNTWGLPQLSGTGTP